MEKLEQMLKQTEQIANEAESKYEEVMYLLNDQLGVVKNDSSIILCTSHTNIYTNIYIFEECMIILFFISY